MANGRSHCVGRPMPDSQPKREINIRKEYLKLITDGVKTVEVRFGYPRMRSIRPGQELTFVSGDQRVPTTVKRVTEYRRSRKCSTARTPARSAVTSARAARTCSA